MRKIIFFILLIGVGLFGTAGAVPDLQLFVAGGSYDRETQTWVTSSSSFDLYVIGANSAMSNVMVSMALNLPLAENPNGTVSIDVNGSTYDDWIFGTPDLLPPHDIFPTWYNEFNAGNFGLIGGVNNTNAPEFYDPSTMGYLSGSHTLGEFKRFSVAITGTDFAHFDGFFYFQGKNNSTKIKFAPFSHDAESHGGAVPEPATMVLFGLGALVIGAARKYMA